MFIFKLKDRRLRARLRSDFPCLVPAVLISCGEVLALYPYGIFSWCFFILVYLCFVGRDYKKIFLILGGLAIGCLSFSRVDIIKSREVVARGVVDDIPRRFTPESITLSIRLKEVESLNKYGKKTSLHLDDQRVLCRAVYLPWRNIYNISEGDVLAFSARLLSLSEKDAASYRRRGYMARCQIKHLTVIHDQGLPLFQKAKSYIAEKAGDVLGDSEERAIFLAASIGYRDAISQRVEYDFKKTGLAHLLVLSGYQITLLYYFLFSILTFLYRKFLVLKLNGWGRSLPAWLALTATTLFICLAGIEGPSVRAGIAALVVVMSATYERSNGMLHSIIVAFLILAVFTPASFLDPGVQLTFAALLGICAALQWQRTDTLFKAYLRVCIFASIFTMPVVLYWFGYLSLIGFICNPIFAPLISVIACKFGFVAILLCVCGLDPGGWFMQLLSTLLFVNSRLIAYLATLPFAGWEVSGVLQIAGVGLTLLPVWYIFEKAGNLYLRQFNLH